MCRCEQAKRTQATAWFSIFFPTAVYTSDQCEPRARRARTQLVLHSSQRSLGAGELPSSVVFLGENTVQHTQFSLGQRCATRVHRHPAAPFTIVLARAQIYSRNSRMRERARWVFGSLAASTVVGDRVCRSICGGSRSMLGPLVSPQLRVVIHQLSWERKFARKR